MPIAGYHHNPVIARRKSFCPIFAECATDFEFFKYLHQKRAIRGGITLRYPKGFLWRVPSLCKLARPKEKRAY
jgi:hypothetical protein